MRGSALFPDFGDRYTLVASYAMRRENVERTITENSSFFKVARQVCAFKIEGERNVSEQSQHDTDGCVLTVISILPPLKRLVSGTAWNQV